MEMSKLMIKDYKKLNDTTIRQHAEKAGLDMAAFDKDYNDPAIKKTIKEDQDQGKKAKVRGVPAIYVNGKPAKKARSLSGLSKMVEDALKNAK